MLAKALIQLLLDQYLDEIDCFLLHDLLSWLTARIGWRPRQSQAQVIHFRIHSFCFLDFQLLLPTTSVLPLGIQSPPLLLFSLDFMPFQLLTFDFNTFLLLPLGVTAFLALPCLFFGRPRRCECLLHKLHSPLPPRTCLDMTYPRLDLHCSFGFSFDQALLTAVLLGCGAQQPSLDSRRCDLPALLLIRAFVVMQGVCRGIQCSFLLERSLVLLLSAVAKAADNPYRCNLLAKLVLLNDGVHLRLLRCCDGERSGSDLAALVLIFFIIFTFFFTVIPILVVMLLIIYVLIIDASTAMHEALLLRICSALVVLFLIVAIAVIGIVALLFWSFKARQAETTPLE